MKTCPNVYYPIYYIQIDIFCFVFQAWDMGHGFSMPELYKTGYTVLGLSIISAAIVALM